MSTFTPIDEIQLLLNHVYAASDNPVPDNEIASKESYAKKLVNVLRNNDINADVQQPNGEGTKKVLVLNNTIVLSDTRTNK